MLPMPCAILPARSDIQVRLRPATRTPEGLSPPGCGGKDNPTKTVEMPLVRETVRSLVSNPCAPGVSSRRT